MALHSVGSHLSGAERYVLVLNTHACSFSVSGSVLSLLRTERRLHIYILKRPMFRTINGELRSLKTASRLYHLCLCAESRLYLSETFSCQ